MNSDLRNDLTRMVNGMTGEDDSILNIETRIVKEVLLTIGGPTIFFRLFFTEDGSELIAGEYHNSELPEPIKLQAADLEEIEEYFI